MKMHAAIIAAGTIAIGSVALAQVAPGLIPVPEEVTRSAAQHKDITSEEKGKLADYLDNWQQQRLTPEDKAKHKTLDQVLAEDKAASTELAKALPLSWKWCRAFVLARGPAVVNGQSVETQSYEVNCANGTGYLLIAQAPERPFGISCFTAEATRDADLKAGNSPGIVCHLSANADADTIASAVMSHGGIPCAANGHRPVGQSSKAKLEFTEVTCGNGPGYMLITALPGSLSAPRAIRCQDAAAQGLPCTMASNVVAGGKP